MGLDGAGRHKKEADIGAKGSHFRDALFISAARC